MPRQEAPAAEGAERLAKRMASAGLCSRREAETWIRSGRVEVDGLQVISPAYNVTAESRIKVDGRLLPAMEPPRMWLYHKPAGLLVSHKDDRGRPTVFENLPKDLPRVVSVGRLDLNSEGLLLLTNSGELARHLELPGTGWVRRYRVRVYGYISNEMVAALAKGVTVDGVRYGSIEVKEESAASAKRKGPVTREKGEHARNVWVLVSLKEGKNREIRKVFEHFSCRVNRLIRVAYGPFQLGSVPAGELREIPKKVLREQVGKGFTF